MTNIAFLGPALGGHDGWVTTQGEVLAGLFAAAGTQVLISSPRIHPVSRAIDHGRDLLRWRHRADVAMVSVFSGRAFALADESLTLARTLGIPTIAWLHGGNLPSFEQSHPRWVRRVLRRADAVVAPSLFLARWADTVVAGTQVIPNVLDLDDYRFRIRSPLRPRLLWMRTFQELYNPAAAIRTLAELRDAGIDASLTMAGQDKGLLPSARSLAVELGVTESIEFAGFVSGLAKTRLLDAHDFFLNTSLVDNAPVTLLEAAAAGLAIVSTDAGGIPDLLMQGCAAALVAPADPSAMARAVTELLHAPGQATTMITEAREVALRSGWPAVRARWVNLYGQLESPRAPPS